MVNIPRGLPAREIRRIIRKEKYREEFLRQMKSFTVYFNALEKAHWNKQDVQFRTEMARKAEEEYLAANKRKI